MSSSAPVPTSGRMSQRTLAGLIALPLALGLVVCALALPLPYTILRPGPTVNLLGTYDGKAIVTVGPGGPKVHDDSGQLRMVTVTETLRTYHPRLVETLIAWASNDEAVFPTSYAYPDSGNAQSDRKEGQTEMTSAQDAAVQVALAALGYHVFTGLRIGMVAKGVPATGVLKPGDVILSVAGKPITTADTLIAAVKALPVGKPAAFVIRRNGAQMAVHISPKLIGGAPHIGVGGLVATVKMPFSVDVTIDPDITGPSAGLMMTLSVYDSLSSGALTGGATIAGTGTIDQDGNVGQIGGIRQKIPAAAHAGAKLFLVPADNCPDVAGSDHGSMRLVKVTTFATALAAVKAWTKDHQASLPTCG